MTADGPAPGHPSDLSTADRALLERLPLFAGLGRETLDRLLAGARVESWRRDSLLFRQDQPATHFYVILVGWLKLYRVSRSGQESVVHVFTRGESLAEAAIFAGGHYPVNALVASPSRLLAIPARPFLEVIDNDPAVARNMLAAMSRHLRQLVTRLEQLSGQPAQQRLASFLLSLAPESDGPLEMRLPVNKSLIAARLGMQPETLSRALAQLREQGVETTGEKIRVPDVGYLRRLAAGD